MNDASLTSSDQKTNYESPYIGLSPNLYRELPRFVARISSRITTVIRIVNTIEEIIAVLPSHSQFRHKTHLYLDLHGLVLETSIYHWQDQPGSLYATGARFRNSLAVQLFVFHIPNTQSLASKSISADASVAFHGPTTTHKNIQPPRGRAAKIGNLAVLSLAVNKTEPVRFQVRCTTTANRRARTATLSIKFL